MKPLSQAVTAISHTVTQADARPSTSQHGFTREVGRETGAARRPPTPDEALDILSTMSTLRPWQIKPMESQKGASIALNALEYCLIPADRKAAAYWIMRLLAHFPRRDSTKDGVVVSDISAAVEKQGLSLIAVAQVYDDLWKESSADNPFLPPSGEILKRIVEQTKTYRWQYERLKNPPAALIEHKRPDMAPLPELPWEGKKWADLDDATRSAYAAYVTTIPTAYLSRRYADFHDCPPFDSEEFSRYLPSPPEQEEMQTEVTI